MKAKKITRYLIFTLIFLFGFYLSFLAFNSASLLIHLKKNNFSKAIKSSSNLTYLTSIFPDSKLHKFSKIASQTLTLTLSSQNTVQAILKNEPEVFRQNFKTLKKQLPQTFANLKYLNNYLENLKPEFIGKKLNQNSKLKSLLTLSQNAIENEEKIIQALDLLHQFLAQDGKKRYIVLLQNNMEIRPSGGFIGSFAMLDFQLGTLSSLRIQDIYVPDGQITGFIKPPDPIQEAFGHGNWKLRDGNWDPDFSISAEAMDWFLTEGGVDTGDGIIAINLNVFEDFLKIIGEVKLPDYDSTINSENLYNIAQYEAERDFFPGSTQKKDFLSSLAKNTQFIAEDISSSQIIDLANSFSSHLSAKDIQFYFADPNLQNYVEKNNWAGRLNFPSSQNTDSDYLYLSEANLGANKANCCIERDLKRKIIEKENVYQVVTDLIYKNNNPYPNPNPPKYWGGNYKNYLRIYLPKNANLINLSINKEKIEEDLLTQKNRDEFVEYGFFITINALEQKSVEFSYELSRENNDYELIIQKQSGIPPYYLTIDYIKDDSTRQTKKLLDQDLKIGF